MAERPCESTPEGLVTSPTRFPLSSAKFDFSSSSIPSDTAARAALEKPSRLIATATMENVNRNFIVLEFLSKVQPHSVGNPIRIGAYRRKAGLSRRRVEV